MKCHVLILFGIICQNGSKGRIYKTFACVCSEQLLTCLVFGAWGAPSATNTGAILPVDHKYHPCWGGCFWNWELILTTHTRTPFRKSSTTSPCLSHTPPSSQMARGQRQKAVCVLTRQKKISHLKKKTLWQSGNSSASEDERSVCSVDVTHVVVIIWEEDPIVLNAARAQTNRLLLSQRPQPR